MFNKFPNFGQQTRKHAKTPEVTGSKDLNEAHLSLSVLSMQLAMLYFGVAVN